MGSALGRGRAGHDARTEGRCYPRARAARKFASVATMSPPISDDARSNSNSDSTPDELLPDPVCVGVLAQLDPLGPLMKTDDELMVLAPERIKAEVQLAAALGQPVRSIV